jgi:3-carboxy-cis,cis-muconate cycloisomerase
VTDLLRLAGGAAAHARELLGELRVHPDRMRANAPDGADAGAADLFVARALRAHEGMVSQ